ncbi:MAG: LLM class F420-dependent oxidoreductase [Actinomycetota bacterium]|nr:LLM class F420-dependent oxidoreductase [Actinomycetota bacterium]
MQIGVVYPQTEMRGDPEAVRLFGAAAEQLGYDYLLAYDHVVGASHDREPALTGPYTEHDPFHDPFVLFAYLAGMTQRIEFATGILILPQRQTVLVARQAADLDLLSGGRFRLGVGTGWNYVEYDALGQDFAVRGPRMDEQVEFLRRLWAEPLLTFEGKFDRIDKASLVPPPARSIPIWMGGFADPAFRRAARCGDGFMFAGSVENALIGWQRIQHYAAEYGRDLTGFGLDLTALRARTPDEADEIAGQWRAAGGTHLTLSTLKRKLDSVEAHIDHMAQLAARVIT